MMFGGVADHLAESDPHALDIARHIVSNLGTAGRISQTEDFSTVSLFINQTIYE